MAERRVLIREPEEADAEAFTAAMRRSRRLHRPWVSMPETPEAFAAYLERAARPNVAMSLVCRTEDGAVVGFANVSEIIMGPLKSAFLGYGGVAGFEGRGYMTEGLELVVRKAFTTLGLHRLEANIQPGNAPSIELAKRIGFELEGFSPEYLKVGGRWRDHERWAIRASAWRTRSRSRG